LRATLVGLTQPHPDVDVELPASGPRLRGQFGTEVMVRHLIGLDPGRRGVAIGDVAPEGTRLAFCERNVQAARTDLIRVCSEVREELEPEDLSLAMASALSATEAEAAPHPARRIAGAIYVSCAGRGGPHFGSPSAELQVVRRALGDVPLVGFFAGGEIAHHRLYGYTGVLTVFTMPAA
ncbi:FIST C-terminal domain-containing protein, partial [Hydrogenophaga sp.]